MREGSEGGSVARVELRDSERDELAKRWVSWSRKDETSGGQK